MAAFGREDTNAAGRICLKGALTMTFERLTIRNSDGTVSQPTSTTIESAFYRLADYEDTDMRPEDIAEYKKFEDWLVENNTTIAHVIEPLQAEKDGLVTVQKRFTEGCCGGCHHFLREKGKRSGVCEVRKYKHYPRAGQPLYCCQSKQACLDFEDLNGRPARYMEGAK